MLTRIDATGGVEGISVLGGEPLHQLPAVTALCAGAQARGLGVLVFSGYTIEEARALPGFERLWPCIDTLVDGRFEARRPDRERRFIGSSNQRLIHRTDRYADPGCWRGEDRAEIQIGPDGGISVHGSPALSARLARALRRAPVG